MFEGFGVRIVREFQREHVGDELLQVGRQRRIGDADLALTDIDLLSGLIDRRDRRKRGLVEQNVGTGMAVRLNQDLEYRGRRQVGQRVWVYERVLGESELDWTIVRPPELTDKLYTGKYRVREGHLPRFGFKISRADVADFMIKVTEDRSSIRKIVGVCN